MRLTNRYRPEAVALSIALLIAVAAPLAAHAQQADRVAVGDEAIDFTMESVDAGSYRLADLLDEKNAILIFFRGTW